MSVRSFLKHIPFVVLMANKYRAIYREKAALRKYDDYAYIRATYLEKFRREINLRNPTSYTEKLQWLKLFYHHDEMPICSDKYRVREYLTQKGYGHILNGMIGVYDDARDIPFADLPQRFVMKATHGSGWNFVCSDKTKIVWQFWKCMANSWLAMDISVFGREWNYRTVPRKILVEQFIEYTPLIDYKFMCCNGEPKYMQINQEIGQHKYVDFFTIEWEHMDFVYSKYVQLGTKPPIPKNMDEMIAIAKDLSKEFPFVRVDFYNCDGKIIFGELTFFPGGGLLPLNPMKNGYDELIGKSLELPEPNSNLELYERIMRGEA